jgi:hypothetical protein
MAGSTQNHKKNTKKIFQKKSMFSTLKRKGAKNSYEDYMTEFAGSTQNVQKIVGTSNQPIRTKFSQKKVCLVP